MAAIFKKGVTEDVKITIHRAATILAAVGTILLPFLFSRMMNEYDARGQKVDSIYAAVLIIREGMKDQKPIIESTQKLAEDNRNSITGLQVSFNDLDLRVDKLEEFNLFHYRKYMHY